MGLDLKVDVPDVGLVRLDVAFGGNFFAALDAASVGLSVRPEQASRLVALGLKIREAANRQLTHPASLAASPPEDPDRDVPGGTEPGPRRGTGRPTSSVTASWIDLPGAPGPARCWPSSTPEASSPLGTRSRRRASSPGSSAGGRYETTSVGPYRAIIPEITGPAFITAHHQFVLDPEDPWRDGFELA